MQHAIMIMAHKNMELFFFLFCYKSDSPCKKSCKEK